MLVTARKINNLVDVHCVRDASAAGSIKSVCRGQITRQMATRNHRQRRYEVAKRSGAREDVALLLPAAKVKSCRPIATQYDFQASLIRSTRTRSILAASGFVSSFRKLSQRAEIRWRSVSAMFGWRRGGGPAASDRPLLVPLIAKDRNAAQTLRASNQIISFQFKSR